MAKTTPEQFLNLFLHEATDLLANLEASLLTLEREPTNPEAIQEAFRCVHSIKGAAASVGLDEVTRFSHACEHRLGEVRAGKIRLDAELAEYLLGCCDTLSNLVHTTAKGQPAPVGWDDRLAELTAPRVARIVPLPASPSAPAADDGFEMLAELRLCSSGDLTAESAPQEQKRFRAMLDQSPAGLVILDLSRTMLSDSTGINLVVGLFKECRKRGRPFHVENVHPNVFRLFRLLTLDRIFDIRAAA